MRAIVAVVKVMEETNYGVLFCKNRTCKTWSFVLLGDDCTVSENFSSAYCRPMLNYGGFVYSYLLNSVTPGSFDVDAR